MNINKVVTCKGLGMRISRVYCTTKSVSELMMAGVCEFRNLGGGGDGGILELESHF